MHLNHFPGVRQLATKTIAVRQLDCTTRGKNPSHGTSIRAVSSNYVSGSQFNIGKKALVAFEQNARVERRVIENQTGQS